jgi:pantoate--beta-alanine ligase
MRIARSVDEVRRAIEEARAEGLTIAFVPTMGALHDGHLSLVRVGRARADIVVLSIFVNPLQFGPGEDLQRYPRDEEGDTRLATEAGVDICFLPSVDEMYPEGRSTTVSVGDLGATLEGADRPGHFDGVATVVAKLFNIVAPDVAVFGQKDAQQVAVIRQMVRDLSFDIEIVVAPTIRESDGLALSSRNAYLSQTDRDRATALHRALLEGERALEREGPEIAEKRMWEVLINEDLEPSYAKAVDPVTLGPPDPEGPVLLLIAARVGATRLIDNLLVDRGTANERKGA